MDAEVHPHRHHPVHHRGSAPRREPRQTSYFPERSAADIAKARAEAEEKAKQDAKEGGKGSVTFVADDKIYLTFQEYAKDNITGFFFEKEKAVKVAGFPAMLHEMKFEKLTSVPQRWLAAPTRSRGASSRRRR